MSILKIRDADGNEQEVLAIRGEPGHTPERGTDYWTEADKAQIVADVIAELPDSEELTAHINDKNNPHKVYVEQIGAAPASQVGDMYEVYSVSHLLELYDPGTHEYIDQNGNKHEQENCTLYLLPFMSDDDEFAKLRGQRLRIKTYAYGDMSYAFGTVNPSGATNTTENIEEDPLSGIWEFEVDVPFNYRGLFLISFCSNEYLNAPKVAISQCTVWEEVKALQYFRDNLADYLPIYNGEVL